MISINDSGYYGDSKQGCTFRKISLDIQRDEKPEIILDYKIKTDIEIIENYEYERNNLRTFFKVSYFCSWVNNKYFDIDRIKNTYEFYCDSILFNCCIVTVNFDKENKNKIKSQIKRIIEKQIKEDSKFYQDYNSSNRPDQVDYKERSDKFENEIKNLEKIEVLNQ